MAAVGFEHIVAQGVHNEEHHIGQVAVALREASALALAQAAVQDKQTAEDPHQAEDQGAPVASPFPGAQQQGGEQPGQNQPGHGHGSRGRQAAGIGGLDSVVDEGPRPPEDLQEQAQAEDRRQGQAPALARSRVAHQAGQAAGGQECESRSQQGVESCGSGQAAQEAEGSLGGAAPGRYDSV